METESPDRSDQRWSSSFAEISQSLKSLRASRYCSCSDTMLCMDCTLPFEVKKDNVNTNYQICINLFEPISVADPVSLE